MYQKELGQRERAARHMCLRHEHCQVWEDLHHFCTLPSSTAPYAPRVLTLDTRSNNESDGGSALPHPLPHPSKGAAHQEPLHKPA